MLIVSSYLPVVFHFNPEGPVTPQKWKTRITIKNKKIFLLTAILDNSHLLYFNSIVYQNDSRQLTRYDKTEN